MVGEELVFKKLPNNNRRVLFIDNVTEHELTDMLKESFVKTNMELRTLPKNAT